MISMMKYLSSSVWVLILMVGLGCALVPNRKFEILPNVVDILQSPDGRVVAAYNDTHIMVYHSHTGAVSQIIEPTSNVTGIAFNQYSTMMGFTQANGVIEVYKVYQKAGQYSLQKWKNKMVRQGNETDPFPVSCCFVAGDYLVTIYNDGMMFGWHPQSDQLMLAGSFQQRGAPKLACSPLDFPQFVIVGLNTTNADENNNLKSKGENGDAVIVSVYTLNHSRLAIEEKVSIVDNNIEYANYIIYDGIGYYIYVLGNDNRVGRYNALTYEYEIFYTNDGNGQLYKILVPFDSQLFALINATHLTYLSNYTLTTYDINTNVEVYETSSKTFAMSSSRLFLLQEEGVTALDMCEEGQFYDGGQCYPCAYECLLCSATKYTCHKCIDIYYYLREPQCLKCIPRCLICVNGLSCQACLNTFVLAQDNTCVCPPNQVIENNLCVCPVGYQIVDNACVKQEGVKFWIIGLIVGSAVLTLALITVVSICIMRSKQAARRNLLLEDQNL